MHNKMILLIRHLRGLNKETLTQDELDKQIMLVTKTISPAQLNAYRRALLLFGIVSSDWDGYRTVYTINKNKNATKNE